MQLAKFMSGSLKGQQRPATRPLPVTLVGCRLGLVAVACVPTVVGLALGAAPAHAVAKASAPTFVISGTVLQGTKGVAGAKVLLIPVPGIPSLATIQHDVLDAQLALKQVKQVPVAANGTYSFTGLAAGTYIVVPYKSDTPFTAAPYKTGAPFVPYALKTIATASSTGLNFLAEPADAAKPAVTVSAPANNASYSPAKVPTAAGTVSDTGSGVLGVGVALAQINSFSFTGLNVSFYNWSANKFDAAVTLTLSSNPALALKPQEIKVAPMTGNAWSLPLPLTLGAGNYRVLPLGVDKAFNIGYPDLLNGQGNFTVAPGAHSAATATAKLSSSTVNAAAGSVTLKFLGALDADAASNAAYYSVTVNGTPVTPESAGYNAATHTVTLALPAGVLQSGDKVIVQWSGL